MSEKSLEEILVAKEFLPARIAMRSAAQKALLEGLPRPPETLLHFTDLDGLVGIVTMGGLRATYAHALNDESEIRYGTEQVRAALLALEAESQQPASYGELLRAMEIDRPYWAAMAAPYVVSFSAKETSAHWLHYGRNGTGVAIKFSSEGLGAHSSAALFPVVYRAEDQNALVRRTLRAIDDEFRRQVSARRDAARAMQELAGGVAHGYLMIAATLMKEAHFSGDDEWRLVHLRGAMMDIRDVSEPIFRCSNGRVRPHVDISWRKIVFPYAGTILGHSCREDSRSPSLRALFWDRYKTLVEEFPRSPIKVRP